MKANVTSNQRVAPYPNMPNELSKPPAAASQGDCPFPHIIGLTGVDSAVTNEMIQQFFMPIRAVAVNNHGNGYVEVAFRTHKEAMDGMGKDNGQLGANEVQLTLKSKAPAQPSGWGYV